MSGESRGAVAASDIPTPALWADPPQKGREECLNATDGSGVGCFGPRIAVPGEIDHGGDAAGGGQVAEGLHGFAHEGRAGPVAAQGHVLARDGGRPGGGGLLPGIDVHAIGVDVSVQAVGAQIWKFLWSDISNFQAYVPGSYQMVVGFDYFPPPERRLSLKSYNRTLTAGRGSLWPGWEVEPEPLADMLNRARSKWWTA